MKREVKKRHSDDRCRAHPADAHFRRLSHLVATHNISKFQAISPQHLVFCP